MDGVPVLWSLQLHLHGIHGEAYILNDQDRMTK